MQGAAQMPLQEVLQALSRTPVTQPQLRAALATTCARWHLSRGDSAEAIRHLGHALEMVPDLRPAMRLLFRIYLDRGDVRSAVMYLDQEIRATRHPREAAALYRERGQLVEAHFHDLGAAQQCYQAALKATPRDLAVLRSVERVSLARGDVFWLIANLESQLEILQDEAAVAGILHDLALLEARHKGDINLAGDLLLAALERFPDHLLLATDLFRLAESGGDAELMLRALEIDAESRPPSNRAPALARASVVLREHRERPAALQLLHAAAHAAPHNLSLWRNLEELATATSRFDVAAEACIGQLKAVGDAEDAGARAELYYRLGKLALFRLERPQEGLAAMRKALRLFPGHPIVMEDTGRFLNAGGMWAQQLELIKLEIAGASEAGLTSEEVALAHLRAGHLMEERLGELEGARRAYEDAIAADPHYRPPRDRLERILHQLGDIEGLERFYAMELDLGQSPERRAFLLSVLGQLHSNDDDPEPAIRYLEEHLALQPRRLSSMQLLARLLARARRDEEVLRVTAQEIEITDSPARRAKLLHRAGELAQQLQQPMRARQYFVEALEAVDDHLPSLEALGNLLRGGGDHAGLVELLRKELLYANDRTRQVALQLEIATLLATRIGRKHEALTELESLLKRWPRHLPALHAAESIAAQLGRADTLLSLLEQHIATVTGPRTRALLLHRAAGIRAAAGDDEGAIRDLVRALDLWPQLGVARAQLLRLYEQLGRSRELQAFAEAGLTSERGADDRRAMALQLAELSPRPVVAIQYLGAVAEARPEDYVTQLRLAQACHEAGRPSRQAGALTAAADRFAEEVPPDDRMVLALRYRAARAEEAAGNLDAADAAYAKLLDVRQDDTLAQRGRMRIKARKKEAAEGRSVEDFERRAEQADNEVHRAALLNIAAELTERRLDMKGALGRVERALQACPRYTPALHTKARLLERIGGEEGLAAARETLEELAAMLIEPTHKAPALCRAGTLALKAGAQGQPNPEAWRLFAEALWTDPDSPRAIRGLRRTRDTHGIEGAPSLADPLRARIETMREAGTLTVSILRELVRLGAGVDGPACAVSLLELGMQSVPDDPRLYADLAQAHARLGRWEAVVEALEAALDREQSPERRAALRYYAGEAHERAGSPEKAVQHYIGAGRSGFHPTHSLLAADRLAAKIGALQERVEALQMLVDVGDGVERIRSLRALADIHRGPLGQPDRAVELMRELLLLRPTDLDVIAELRRLLDSLQRPDEGMAVLLAGIAHHRAWLRSADGGDTEELDPAPIVGLMRLHAAMGERTGVYIGACVLERLAPSMVPAGHRPDDLVVEPWPLPKPQEGRPFDGLIGDLPGSAALDLLREGVFYVADLQIGPPPSVDLAPSRSLPSNNAAVIVARTLAGAMGVPHPLVFLDEQLEDTVVAHVTPVPCLVVGRRVASAPAGVIARDAIGRALLRLSTGGDGLHRHATAAQLVGLLYALTRAVDIEVDLDRSVPPDMAFAEAVLGGLPSRDALDELHDVAVAFRNAAERFDVKSLLTSLMMAEDRAGAACAGDPRPALDRVVAEGMHSRARMLVGYLMSDDHLNLRRTLGYHVELIGAPRSAAEARA
jgi:tetratricopeptide (TPR) repeat protein